MRKIQTFEVSLKAFIRDGDRVLMLREADTGYWELPGGRIDAGEEWQDHAVILAREIGEELGTELRITTTERVTTWTRQRPDDGAFQFIVGRMCLYHGGAITLSGEHDRFDWVDRTAAAALRIPPRSGYAAALDRLWAMSA
jgi:8-oxo-dGTP pyrophosphatase MutT (NUDIX family)